MDLYRLEQDTATPHPAATPEMSVGNTASPQASLLGEITARVKLPPS